MSNITKNAESIIHKAENKLRKELLIQQKQYKLHINMQKLNPSSKKQKRKIKLKSYQKCWNFDLRSHKQASKQPTNRTNAQINTRIPNKIKTQ